ncbi:hypothetical protein [Rhizobacter sp. P5_C2]
MNVSAFLVNNTLAESDEEFLQAIGFTQIERVTDWHDADFGFIRHKGCFLLFAYGQYESAASGAVERGDDALSGVLSQIFPESDVLAVVLQSSTDLAGFSLFSKGRNIRRWCVAGDHGTLVDEGQVLSAEERAAAQDLDGEAVIHAVTTDVLEFDLLEVFEARTASRAEERLFRARADA